MTNRTDAIKLAIEALERNKRGLENIELFGKSNVKFSGLTEMIEKTGAALAALQAREGEAVANSAILARGRFHTFKGEDGEPDDWEWFEEGTNCEHGCIDAVIVRADAIAAPQPAQPLTDEDCTRIYNEANNITVKNPPISTSRIFAAMRAAHIHGSTT